MKPTLKMILDLLPKQDCLSDKSFDKLYALIDDFCDDYRFEFFRIKDNLKNDFIEKFGEKHLNILEKYDDDVNDEIYVRDETELTIPLLRNTSNQALFIDTVLEFYDSSFAKPAEIRLSRMQIKKFFSIYDKQIDLMLLQASYGGNLRVYFNTGFDNLFEAIISNKSILFDGEINIAIANSSNGSGDHCIIKGKVLLPLDVFICKQVKYSYTHDVCGMYDNWCCTTQFEFTDEKPIDINSSTKQYMLEESKLNRVFESGKCTFGDMKFTRHRKIEYINDYPCGSKCKDCGTFWID